MTIAKKLALGFAVPLAFLILTGSVAYYQVQGNIERDQWVSHTHQARADIRSVLAELLNAETGQRGYLLTGEDRYLEPYRAAIAAVDDRIRVIGSLTMDNAKQQSRLTRLKPLIAAKLDELRETIQLRKEKTSEAALEIVRGDKGKKYMDDIRAVLDEMWNEEEELLLKRRADAQDSQTATLHFILYGTLLAFLATGIVGFYIVRGLTISVGETANSLSSSTAEILAGTTQQASGAQEQAAAVTETVATVDEVVQTSEQAAQRAKAVAESSQRAVEVGKAGRRAVDETVTAMGAVKEQSESIAESILALAEQAQAIGEIIATVNDIAEQTNLLALNAAIEASRAGEQGKGFAVVAGEIKTLADQSKKATAQVRQILGEIQKATNSSVLLTEEGTKSVAAALKAVNQAGETIKALAETITEAAQAAAQIAASAGQQATGMSQIHQAMKNVNQVTTQNLASTKQAERAAQDLNALGVKLKQLVGS